MIYGTGIWGVGKWNDETSIYFKEQSLSVIYSSEGVGGSGGLFGMGLFGMGYFGMGDDSISTINDPSYDKEYPITVIYSRESVYG